MRPVIVLSTAFGLTLATLQLLHAQDSLGSAQSGRRSRKLLVHWMPLG